MRDWLSHRVVSSPDDVALVRAEDGEAWSYSDLDRLVAETAGRLVAHGIGPGDRVGVLTPPYVGTVGLIHAAMRIGATFVPLGERLTPRELGERVDRADLSAVICSESTESDALAAVDDVPVCSVDEPAADAVEAVHDVEPEPVEPAEWSFDDRLCILFTSGTTGEPKPVPLTAGNVYSSAVASAFRLGIDPDDRWLVSLALHHMGGLAPVYRSALYGTTVVLREGFDPGGTADDINRYDVTGVSLVPTMLTRMLDRRGTLSDSLRVVLLGGAPAPDELIERCRDYSIPVYPTYGMTEAASQVATATPRATKKRTDTVGRPLFGTDVTVVDEDGAPVPAGETGEIVVDGPTITPGYMGVDDPTAAFGPYGLHTGDIGRIDEEGYLYVLNRLDDRIISGGENVEPGEVSDVLRAYPGVDDVAVVGLDDEVWGERVAALVAVDGAELSAETEPDPADELPATEEGVSGDDAKPEGGVNPGNETEEAPASAEVTTPGDAIDDVELMSFVRDRLARFKIPRTIAYTDELPRTVSGTIDRDVVRERLVETGYEPRDGFGAAGFEPADPKPTSRTEAGGDDVEPAGDESAGDGPARAGGTGTADAANGPDETESIGPRTDLTAEVLDGEEADPTSTESDPTPTESDPTPTESDPTSTDDDRDGDSVDDASAADSGTQ
ncbi:O-succinylbenzoic acid--CoA ligase [Halorubrum alkaliphilum]|uniref:2-succinylbenzoate--CoA ligase n=1 Tax=Halorubrum alkaliphilum TaxID=261290 RepID=A0A8T4GED5_9EURY|nr:o-succinylbenzoate--CoA ligase [Halorubrum alkaliphilum]MBP1922503.1 O-succinylbenzoic acid--CoA ligase [Halorubrum alkaliphilum]